MPKNEKNDNWMCWRRKKQCDPKVGGCGHRFIGKDNSDSEYHLWECPECGRDRHCRNPVSYDGEACRFHGGESPKGAEHYNYRTGDYSIHLPKDMYLDYQDFYNDPQRLSVEKEMALVRTLVTDRIKSIREFHSPQAWIEAQKIYKKALTAQRQGQSERFASLFLDLGDIFEKGAADAGNRREVIRLVETERKLVDTQRQLYIDLGEFITRGMALTMFGRFMEAVKENVLQLEGGPSALTRIAGAIASFAGGLRQPRTSAGGEKVISVEGDMAD